MTFHLNRLILCTIRTLFSRAIEKKIKKTCSGPTGKIHARHSFIIDEHIEIKEKTYRSKRPVLA